MVALLRLGVVSQLLLLLLSFVSVQAQQAPAPTNLAASDTTGTGTYLTWTEPTDSNGVVSGYNVYRCEGSSCNPNPDTDWIAWVDGNATTYYGDYTLSLGTTYRYAVNSSRGTGTESALSNVVTVATLSQAPAPTGLTVTGTTATTISLSWTAPADDGNGAILGYNVYSCEEGMTACTPVWLAWVDGGTTTTYTHSSLTTGTTHRYAVGSSRGTDTESVWSDQVTATAETETLSQAPAPTGLTVTGTTATSISLSWTAPADDGNGAIAWL